MKRIQYLSLVFLLLDYVLAHIDGLYADGTALKQFYIYDVATFCRIGLLVVQLGLFVITCKWYKSLISINWVIIFAYIAYWSFAMYEFKQWLDFQYALSHG